MDQATFVVYDPVRNEVVSAEKIAPRSALKFKMIVPFDYTGSEVHCWMYFVSPTGKAVSTSSYLGKHTVL